jgi:lipase chaperone LimK
VTSTEYSCYTSIKKNSCKPCVQVFEREVSDAFFGDEDAYDRYTMARIEVMQDKSLSATEKLKVLRSY